MKLQRIIRTEANIQSSFEEIYDRVSLIGKKQRVIA